MRSLWGKAPFQFQLRELPIVGGLSKADPGEVVVKIAACTIRYSLFAHLHFLRHNEDWTPLGHEVVGTIVAVGGLSEADCGPLAGWRDGHRGEPYRLRRLRAM
jgi:threonine dehydrogenase-like Zn-dependent dehydrogenase